MPMETETLKLILAASNQMAGDLRAAQEQIKSLKAEAKSANNSLNNMMKIASVVGGAVALLNFTRKCSEEFENEQAQAAKLNQVLISTGHAAGITAVQAFDLANNMANLAGVDDEAVVSAEAILLTFTAIGKDVFPQAMEATMDLARMMSGDLQGATVQIGKALQDPIRGITALSKAGVNFSAQQRHVIKSLVDTGRVAEAQKVILKELNKEFGGQAAAFGKTSAGQRQRLANATGDVKAAVGKNWTDWLGPLRGGLTDLFNGLAPIIKRGPDAFGFMMEKKAQEASIAAYYAFKTIVESVGAVVNTIWVNIQNMVIKGINFIIENLKKVPILKDQMAGVKLLELKADPGNLKDQFATIKAANDKQSKELIAVQEKLLTDYNTQTDADAAKQDAILAALNKNGTAPTNPGYNTNPGGINTTMSDIYQLLRDAADENAAAARAARIQAEMAAGAAEQARLRDAENTGFATFTNELAQAGGVLGEIGPALANAARNGDVLGAVMVMLTPVFRGLMSVIAPATNQILTPLFNALLIVGRVVGQLLVPVLNLLVPVIQWVATGLVWLYNNAIMPVANFFIMIFNTVHNAINAFIRWIYGFWGGDTSGIVDVAANSGMLTAISMTDLNAESTGGAGANSAQGAQYSGGKTVNVSVYFQDQAIFVGDNNSGLASLAREIKREFLRFEELGV